MHIILPVHSIKETEQVVMVIPENIHVHVHVSPIFSHVLDDVCFPVAIHFQQVHTTGGIC